MWAQSNVIAVDNGGLFMGLNTSPRRGKVRLGVFCNLAFGPRYLRPTADILFLKVVYGIIQKTKRTNRKRFDRKPGPDKVGCFC